MLFDSLIITIILVMLSLGCWLCLLIEERLYDRKGRKQIDYTEEVESMPEMYRRD